MARESVSAARFRNVRVATRSQSRLRDASERSAHSAELREIGQPRRELFGRALQARSCTFELQYLTDQWQSRKARTSILSSW